MDKSEKLLREKRIIEATKKDFVGAAGKLGAIVKYLGQPIIRQGSPESYFSIDDLLELEDDEAIPVGDDTYTYQEGWVFDGLSRGMHLEIKYIDPEKKLIVHYKGYRVYEEIAGDLEAYAPFPEWEDLVERLYKSAQEKKKERKQEYKALRQAEIKQEQASFLERLRMRWGI